MDKRPVSVDQDEARDRFIACSVAVGYAYDSGRAEIAESFQGDFLPLLVLMADESKRELVLQELMGTAASPWVSYQAAVLMARYSKEKAIATFRRLSQMERGMFIPLSMLALHSLEAALVARGI